MTEPTGGRRSSRLTARGAATRARIVEAAAELMYVRGVAATSLDEVLAASGTSKSQFYHHFGDKDELVSAVLALQAGQVLEREGGRLQGLSSVRGLERWRDAIVQNNGLRRGAYGCRLGSLASELADQSEDARSALAVSFEQWEKLLATGLERMAAKGILRADADAAALATGIMAALQGGYLLAQTARDVTPMEIALNMAIDNVRAWATPAP